MSEPNYDPTKGVSTGAIMSKPLSPQGEKNWDLIFGPKKKVRNCEGCIDGRCNGACFSSEEKSK